tara:strand:- start:221 stop:829 length:609 start_codon:yes stop_codon:yes gene_type:complete
VLEGITSSVVDWGSSFGLAGLALVSASESIIQPVPPDLLVIPMSLEAGSSLELLAIFLVVTISSVLGSLGGYAIGLYAGRPIIGRFAKPSLSRRLDEILQRYGDAGVFIAAVSPIPYKLLAWTAGAGRMNLKPFVLAGIFGRGIRFGLQVLIIGYWGDEFMNHLDNPIFWIVVCLFSFLAFLPLNSWWKGLDSQSDNYLQQN